MNRMEISKERLIKIIEKNNLYPDKVIFSKVGFSWLLIDHEKIISLNNKKDCEFLNTFNSNTIIVYFDAF